MSDNKTSEETCSSQETITKPTPREKISHFISRHDLKMCMLCYVVGVVWFILLAHPELNGRTYFSENALLPGLVESDFHNDNGASDYLRQLKDEVRKQKSDDDLRFAIPVEWLTRTMNEIGLDTYVQNYTFKYPNNIFKQKVFTGRNVYGILRAVRTPGTEALVLSAPYRPEPYAVNTLSGIALMLGIAKAFRSHLYWAKDIIFLVTEDDEVGMQSWLSAYHHTFNDYIKPGELPGRSGAIQAALNLEIGTDTISRLDVRIEGLNGQLPNLDFVNTAVRLCKREGITPTLQKRTDHVYLESFDGFVHSLKTMLMQMSLLATGSPTGNHGLFHRYNIEAITLHSVKLKSSRITFGFTDVGRVVEGIFRSLNNLLERFHQSFFFYLMPSVERYVSIGVYMPPFGVLALPLVIKVMFLVGYRQPPEPVLPLSDRHNMTYLVLTYRKMPINQSINVISLWLSCSLSNIPVTSDGKLADVKNEEIPKSDSVPMKSAKQESPSGKQKSGVKSAIPIKNGEQQKVGDTSQSHESSSWVFSYFLCLLTSSFFGMFAFYGPPTFVRMSHEAHIEVPTAIAFGFGIIHLLIIASPFVVKRWTLSTKRYDNTLGQQKLDANLVKCFALIMLGIVLGTTAVVNISLAFFIAVIAVPVTIFVSPTQSRILNGIKRLLLVIISPFSAICLASLIKVLLNQKMSTDLWTTVAESWSNIELGIMSSVVQMDMFDNWTYGLVSLAYLTNWALFWQVMSCDPVL